MHYTRWKRHGDPDAVHSAGQANAARLAKRNYKHGHATRKQTSPEYKIWSGMIKRCENERNRSYNKYGAQGVTVCGEWRQSFEAFYRDMGPRPSPQHSLDRYPNRKGNYERDNVRWATREEQMRNVDSNVILEINGVSRCLVEWAEVSGIAAHTIRRRKVDLGWSAQAAVFTPVRSRSRAMAAIARSNERSL